MSASTIFLARFTDTDKLLPALAHLRSLKSSFEWEALDGHMQLAVRTPDPDHVESELSNLNGLESLIRCDIIREYGAWPGTALDAPRTWICVETEPSRQQEVAGQMSKLSGLKYLAHTSGACDLLGIIEGQSLSQLERTVSEKIRPIDGVIRMKHDRVISLTQL